MLNYDREDMFDINYKDTIDKYPYINIAEIIFAKNQLYYRQIEQYIINAVILAYKDPTCKSVFYSKESFFTKNVSFKLKNGSIFIYNYSNEFSDNSITTYLTFRILNEYNDSIVHGFIDFYRDFDSDKLHAESNRVNIHIVTENIKNNILERLKFFNKFYEKYNINIEYVREYIEDVKNKNLILKDYVNKLDYIIYDNIV